MPRFVFAGVVLVAACASHAPEAHPTAATVTAAPSAPRPTLAPAPKNRVLAHGLGGVESLAADDSYVYVAKKGGEIVRVALDGSGATTVTTLPRGLEAMALAPSREGLYVATAAGGEDALKSGSFGMGDILLVGADGKAATLSSGYFMPTSVVLDDANVYWAAADKKKTWSIYSASRKTGTPVRAKKLEGAMLVHLYAVHDGAAILAGALGGLVLQPLGANAKTGPTVASSMQIQDAAVAGDRAAVAGSDLDVEHGAKETHVVGVSSLASPDHAFTKLATVADDVESVTLLGDGVYYTKPGTHAGHYQDGQVVRVSLTDQRATVVADHQLQPGKILATPRGVVWINERGQFVSGDGDAELVLGR